RGRPRPPPAGGRCAPRRCGGGRAGRTALHRWAPAASGLGSVSGGREGRRRPGRGSCNMLKRGRPPWSGAFLVWWAASDGSRNLLGLAYSLGFLFGLRLLRRAFSLEVLPAADDLPLCARKRRGLLVPLSRQRYRCDRCEHLRSLDGGVPPRDTLLPDV